MGGPNRNECMESLNKQRLAKSMFKGKRFFLIIKQSFYHDVWGGHGLCIVVSNFYFDIYEPWTKSLRGGGLFSDSYDSGHNESMSYIHLDETTCNQLKMSWRGCLRYRFNAYKKCRFISFLPSIFTKIGCKSKPESIVFLGFDTGKSSILLDNVSAASVFLVFRQPEPLQVSKRYLL